MIFEDMKTFALIHYFLRGKKNKMNIIDAPLDGGQILHFGSKEDAIEHKRFIDARAEFSLRYMKEKGWGDDPTKISIQQLLEIRAQKEWKNPKSQCNSI